MRQLLLLCVIVLSIFALGCNTDNGPQTTYFYDQNGNVVVVDQYGNRLN
jgi:hypothetical protein